MMFSLARVEFNRPIYFVYILPSKTINILTDKKKASNGKEARREKGMHNRNRKSGKSENLSLSLFLSFEIL